MKNCCIICDVPTNPTEKLYSIDFGYKKKKNMPLCSTCEKDLTKYMRAVVFAKAYWRS